MSKTPLVKVYCSFCGENLFETPLGVIVERAFCSRSCCTSFKSGLETRGTTRSKIEKYMEKRLSSRYPDLGFLFNCRSVIGLELDIYIPSLQLAFEINGVFHYLPIYGHEKLATTKDNDKSKKERCRRRLIDLHVIDISSEKAFSALSSKKYYDFIVSKIDEKLDKK